LRKIRKLSLFGILGVVIAVLFLISISFTQAQVSIQAKGGKPGKPDKPPKPPPEPEATWAVQLPVAGTGGTMLYGDGTTYINNNIDMIIKVEKGFSLISRGQLAFHYYFSFKLVNSTERFAGFQNVGLTTVGDPESPFCIFPVGCGFLTPTCLECFLNQNQPHPEYEYFNLKFEVGQGSFTAGLGYIIEGIEDENWNYNYPVKFISFSDWIKFRVQNQEDFSYPYTDYHNVECDERNHDDDILENMNIWIEKLNKDNYTFQDETITGCDGVWRIRVTNEDLWVQEQYTARVTGKKGKGGKTETVVPLEARGDFSFYIDFIKNPATE